MLPFSIKIKDCRSDNFRLYFFNTALPASDCMGVKKILDLEFLLITKFTALLQKLQIPSNSIMGGWFKCNKKLTYNLCANK